MSLITYARDSLDRFGDDMCGQLLRPLTLDRRLRLECVSRQWRRVIYTTQTLLDFNYIHVWNRYFTDDDNQDNTCLSDEEWLKLSAIVRKCPDYECVESRDLSIDERIARLVLISGARLAAIYGADKLFHFRYRHQLIAIRWQLVAAYNFQHFFYENQLKFGQKLRSISLSSAESHLNFGPLFCLKSVILFRQLRHLSLNYRKESAKQFASFVHNYGRTLKSIDVTVQMTSNHTNKSLEILMTGLSGMEALVNLRLDCFYAKGSLTRPVPQQLRNIGIKCRRLRGLSLTVRMENIVVNELLLEAIGDSFRRLKRLTIIGKLPINYQTIPNAFKTLNGLTHLTIRSLSHYYTEHQIHGLFLGLDKHWPSLRHLSLSKFDITGEALVSIGRLKHIQTVQMDGQKEFADTDLMTLIDNCPKITEMLINDQNYV